MALPTAFAGCVKNGIVTVTILTKGGNCYGVSFTVGKAGESDRAETILRKAGIPTPIRTEIRKSVSGQVTVV